MKKKLPKKIKINKGKYAWPLGYDEDADELQHKFNKLIDYLKERDK